MYNLYDSNSGMIVAVVSTLPINVPIVPSIKSVTEPKPRIVAVKR